MAGRSFTELGQPTRAEPLLRDAIAHYDHTHARETALYRSWLAQAYIEAGEIEEVCAEAIRALDLTEGVNSARAAERVHTIRRALRPFADVPAVRDFEERCALVGLPA
jgi:hypothetical protein